jgi:protocatechuate 3,4-dioxygenase beta subunit
MLARLGGAGMTMLAEWAPRHARAASPACVATPAQTEGPYFVDERLQRSDIRVDPADGSTKQGVPLTLRLSVSSISGGACRPLAGAIVDIWHCDALGVYSDVTDPGFSTVGKKFLRGYQVTGANGAAEFITIYPGWYEGRTVHIHFKVRTDPKSGPVREFTSQLYFDESITERVYERMPYAKNGRRRVKNEEDGIFRDSGNRLMLPLVEIAQGYSARFDIGLRTA